MKLKLAALVVTLSLCVTTSSFGQSVWCGVVKDGIPDDYLNVRTGPGVEYSIIERIFPGDAVGVSTARCGLDTYGMTLCTGATSDWRFLERKFSGEPAAANAAEYSGWVNSIYLTETPCLN